MTHASSEEEIKAVLAGRAKHHPHQKQPPKEQTFQLLVDIQAKLAEGKGGGYERWAKKHNLKEMSKTLIFLQQHGRNGMVQKKVNWSIQASLMVWHSKLHLMHSLQN